MGDLEHLKAQLAPIPWCDRLLRDESLVLTVPTGRQIKRSREDAAFAYTFNTKDTIPLYVALYHPPRQEGTPIDEVKGILQLGGGLNGFPDVCHGGIVATILDEVMGELINVNLKHRAILRTSYMTAYINTTYLKPVSTPATVLARARIGRFEGKKLYISSTIEDGQGTVLAKAESLFIGLNRKVKL